MGLVRDAQGVGQMGAMVEVLAADASPVGTAFTDLHGRYLIRNIVPGNYQVRASATLFVPATKGNLQLRRGAQAVVNLTLAALFDTTQWLPAERRRADEPADDWRWTLRSSANRPVLRILDDGSVMLVGSGEQPDGAASPPRMTVAGGNGGFGAGGAHGIVSGDRTFGNGTGVLMRADLGVGGSSEVAGGVERAIGIDGKQRTMFSVRSHPELIGPDGSRGMEVVEMSGAQAASFGDMVDVEFGGGMRAVHTASSSAFQSTPFLRLTAHPTGAWTIRYQLATSRDLQGVDDLNPKDELPVAAVSGGRLVLESGRHQEIAITRRAGQGVIEVAVFQDALDRVGVGGVGSTSARMGLNLDPSTGSFQMLSAGYSGNGAEAMLSSPLPSGIRATVQYSLGSALGPGLRPYPSQAATVALKGRIKGSGTQVRALYRWQPSRMVTAVNPYGAFSDQGFLSCSMRQPLHWGDHLPPGMSATIDITNLLEEGYRPFLSADGQTLYFAQAPRTMTAGLSFTF
jgi:hypothetical protein